MIWNIVGTGRLLSHILRADPRLLVVSSFTVYTTVRTWLCTLAVLKR